ncbi:MAG: hypothetical protein KCHDKBKB_02103 [Elusimicrobia bacterium]|nr:hypothetical protein [Elusimicrobiota bacterium]
MHSLFSRTLTLVLATLLTAQTALASTAEANFWSERRKAHQQAHQRQSSPQFASLAPTRTMGTSALLNQLPSLRPPIASEHKWNKADKKKYAQFSRSFQSLIHSIPLVYGTIQEAHESTEDEKNPPVVLVQDVHLNSEAQSNIAALLQELIDQGQVGLVGVEGAFEKFDFAPFRAFADKKLTQQVAQAFMDKNLLAAPSFVGVTSLVEPPLFWGIDDREHHKANVEAYLATRKIKSTVQTDIFLRERALAEQKRALFPPDLQRFDDLRSAHHQGNVGLGTYVKKLAPYEEEHDFAIEQFLAAHNMELGLDFARVEFERKSVIEKLTRSLNEAEVSELVSQSLAYRGGQMGFGVYYQNLKDLCRRKGVDLKKYPAFDNYIRYVLLSDGIKAESLFAAVHHMEERIADRLATTLKQKDLLTQSDLLALSRKLIDFSLTPQEWEEYRKLSKNNSSPLGKNGEELEPRLKNFERFYEQADLRSHKMIENLLAQIPNSKSEILNPNEGSNQKSQFPNINELGFRISNLGIPKPKVLVVGGFHTELLTALFKEKKIPYIVVSPKITKIEDESGVSYLSVFSREKTPLEKIFEGPKLFVNPPTTNITWRALAVALLAAITYTSTQTNPVKVKTREGAEIEVHVPEVITDLEKYRPLTSVFTETGLLWVLTSLINGTLSLLGTPDLLLGMASLFIIPLLAFGFAWAHADFRKKLKQQGFRAFASQEFLQRLFGGLALIFILYFQPGLEGFLRSASLHLIPNSFYFIRTNSSHTPIGRWLNQTIIRKLLPLSIGHRDGRDESVEFVTLAFPAAQSTKNATSNGGWTFKGSANIGGEKEKEFWVDSNNELWIFKLNRKDSYRPYAARLFYKIASRLRFAVPIYRAYRTYKEGTVIEGTLEKVMMKENNKNSDWRNLDNQAIHDRFKVVALPNLKASNIPVSKMTQNQIKNVMEELVLDWLLSNHDSHVGNFLVAEDGTLIGIDKEQPFKFFPNDKLELHWNPNQLDPPVWHSVVLYLLMNKNLSMNWVADIIAKLEAIDDDELRILLRPVAIKYVESHSKHIQDPDEFIEAVIRRKNNLRDNFSSFFNSLNRAIGAVGLNKKLISLRQKPDYALGLKEYLGIYKGTLLSNALGLSSNPKKSVLSQSLYGKLNSPHIPPINLLANFFKNEIFTKKPVPPQPVVGGIVFNPQPAFQQGLATLYGQTKEFLEEVRNTLASADNFISSVNAQFNRLKSRAPPGELEKKRDSIKAEIKNPGSHTKRLKAMFRLLTAWVERVVDARSNFHRVYLARDAGIFHAVDQALDQNRTVSMEGNAGSSVYHLSRARMSGEKSEHVYAVMHNICIQAKYSVVGENLKMLNSNIRKGFDAAYNNDPSFRFIADEVLKELIEIGYHNQPALLFVDTGFVGTVPFFLKCLLDRHWEGRKEPTTINGEPRAQVALVETNGIGFAKALFGFSLDLFSNEQKNVLKKFQTSHSLGASLEGATDHPIRFNDDSWLIEETDAATQLQFYFEKILALQAVLEHLSEIEVKDDAYAHFKNLSDIYELINLDRKENLGDLENQNQIAELFSPLTKEQFKSMYIQNYLKMQGSPQLKSHYFTWLYFVILSFAFFFVSEIGLFLIGGVVLFQLLIPTLKGLFSKKEKSKPVDPWAGSTIISFGHTFFDVQTTSQLPWHKRMVRKVVSFTKKVFGQKEGGNKPFSIFNESHKELSQQRQNAGGRRSPWVHVLWVLTHPLAAALTETAGLKLIWEVAAWGLDQAGMGGSVVAVGLAVALIAGVFAAAHEDVRVQAREQGWASALRSWPFGWRLMGGLLFVSLFYFAPGWDGVAWNLAIHGGLNLMALVIQLVRNHFPNSWPGRWINNSFLRHLLPFSIGGTFEQQLEQRISSQPYITDIINILEESNPKLDSHEQFNVPQILEQIHQIQNGQASITAIPERYGLRRKMARLMIMHSRSFEQLRSFVSEIGPLIPNDGSNRPTIFPEQLINIINGLEVLPSPHLDLELVPRNYQLWSTLRVMLLIQDADLEDEDKKALLAQRAEGKFDQDVNDQDLQKAIAAIQKAKAPTSGQTPADLAIAFAERVIRRLDLDRIAEAEQGLVSSDVPSDTANRLRNELNKLKKSQYATGLKFARNNLLKGDKAAMKKFYEARSKLFSQDPELGEYFSNGWGARLNVQSETSVRTEPLKPSVATNAQPANPSPLEKTDSVTVPTAPVSPYAQLDNSAFLASAQTLLLAMENFINGNQQTHDSLKERTAMAQEVARRLAGDNLEEEARRIFQAFTVANSAVAEILTIRGLVKGLRGAIAANDHGAIETMRDQGDRLPVPGRDNIYRNSILREQTTFLNEIRQVNRAATQGKTVSAPPPAIEVKSTEESSHENEELMRVRDQAREEIKRLESLIENYQSRNGNLPEISTENLDGFLRQLERFPSNEDIQNLIRKLQLTREAVVELQRLRNMVRTVREAQQVGFSNLVAEISNEFDVELDHLAAHSPSGIMKVAIDLGHYALRNALRGPMKGVSDVPDVTENNPYVIMRAQYKGSLGNIGDAHIIAAYNQHRQLYSDPNRYANLSPRVQAEAARRLRNLDRAFLHIARERGPEFRQSAKRAGINLDQLSRDYPEENDSGESPNESTSGGGNPNNPGSSRFLPLLIGALTAGLLGSVDKPLFAGTFMSSASQVLLDVMNDGTSIINVYSIYIAWLFVIAACITLLVGFYSRWKNKTPDNQINQTAHRLAELAKMTAKGNEAQLLQFLTENVVSVSDLGGARAANKDQAFLNDLQKHIEEGSFDGLLQAELKRQDLTRQDVNVDLLLAILMAMGLGKSEPQKKATQLTTAVERVLTIDGILHEKIMRSSRPDVFVRGALLRAGVSSKTPVRICLSPEIAGQDEVQKYYQGLVVKISNENWTGSIQVVNLPDGIIVDQKIDILALQRTLRIAHADMMLIRPQHLDPLEIDPSSESYADFKRLQSISQIFEVLVPLDNPDVDRIIERLRAVLEKA